jgi:hypothetical protein
MCGRAAMAGCTLVGVCRRAKHGSAS